MHHLRNLSLLMVALGALLIAAAVVGPLGPAWTLAGLLLILAGVVKVVVVALWRGVADLSAAGEDPHGTGRDDA